MARNLLAPGKCLLITLVPMFGLLLTNAAYAEDSLASPKEGQVSEAAQAAGTAETAKPKAVEKKTTLPDVRLRDRPSYEPVPVEYPPYIYESVPDINSSASEFVAVPDRWRQLYKGKWYDPYNQNVLKGDIPVFGTQAHPWFFELSIISDTLAEFRQLPTPIGAAGSSTRRPGSTDLFGNGQQSIVAENLVVSIGLIQGNTTFKPQDIEFRFVPVFNLNYADLNEDGLVRIDPSKGNSRVDNFMGIQELFADIHIANVSERYDFVSSRVGIQPFISDFRGFVFNSAEPGARIFGNFDNNKWQYNLAYFRRLDKDSNSGNNIAFEDRYENVWVANVYHQDAPVLGHTMQGTVIHREDVAGEHAPDYDNNGFLVRPVSIGDEKPKNVYTTYLGLNGDGHIGRINLTESFYYVFGSESHNQIAGRQVDISAAMLALEASYDMDWMRIRTSFFWASGDDDPFDDEANGFDSIIDNPNFAGGDISFWQRQGLPLIGGGVTNLKNRNSLLPDFKPGKEEGQSNFVNPGVRLYNLGVDFEVTPKLKLINNISFLQFDKIDTLKTVRQDGSFSKDIGIDLSTGLLYRPFLNNNVQFRLGYSALLPGDGLQNLYSDKTLYNIFSNMIFLY